FELAKSEETKSLISVGSFIAFITAFGQFLGECLNMSFAFITSLNIIPLYERVQPIFQETPETQANFKDIGMLKGEIEFNQIFFRYQEDLPLVLDNVSFTIKAGEMVAFVGPSGSGKSTVLRILLGFEKPVSGSVYYDGQEFLTLNKDLLRKQLGVVLQNGSLLPGSILKNIVGNANLNVADAWEAARMAGIEKDIQEMPMGIHTVISEGATTISGGQKQRLMIARALVHKPTVIIMDEATSALDNRTQKIVKDSLDRLQATRIIVAHRLSTIKNADRIFVFDQGKIVETGDYATLVKKGGLFAELANRQLL
ncbi:MAG: ATP-binding cassette domain-containing protein, partial [Bacteroidota bacterium]